MTEYVSLASAESAWRGYDYYKRNKVLTVEPCGEAQYKGRVSGSNENVYDVRIGLKHPRLDSKCTCPHALGRRLICKHMVALYFAAFPDKAESYYSEQLRYAEECEQWEQEMSDALNKALSKMTKSELRDALESLLEECPEWLYDRFLQEYVEQYYLE